MDPRFKVLLWKNILIRRRHWFLLICEACLPVLLFLLVAYGRSNITGLKKTEVLEVTHNYNELLYYASPNINLGETHFYYSPSNEFFQDIIHSVQEKLSIINNNVHGFPNEKSLLNNVKSAKNNGTVFAILFHSPQNSSTLDYTIRYQEEFQKWKTDKYYTNIYSFSPGKGTQYIYRGFVVLQLALDMSFIEKMSNKQPDVSVNMLEFPYPPYKVDDGLTSIFIHCLPLITMLSFIFICPAVLKRVVEEKHSGIKELMRMVGMKRWMLWLSWHLYSIIPMIISVILITFVMKVPLFGQSLIQYTSAFLMLLYLILYCLAITSFVFFLSTLFEKPTLAMLVAVIVWMVTYLGPTYTIVNSDKPPPVSTRCLLMLLPNMALYFGYSSVSLYEEREIGVHFSNFYLPGDGSTNGCTLLEVFIMLIVDVVLYMVLTLYVDAINPGRYGVRESVFFPLKRLINRMFRSRTVPVSNGDASQLEILEKGSYKKSIELSKVTKKYGQKMAVDGLSLDIYKNHITVLLGHNGAGKSTTMGMITGLIRKTAGQIRVNGQEITSPSDLTDKIGLCTQYNLFFPSLTVEEHLKFFAMLKGSSGDTAAEQVDNMLIKINMESARRKFPCSLSGGMKRKLCLGMAAIGDSQILILDEPSSGMDPESRRQLWNMLLAWRTDKTILITTHFMEEADALADWIAIMYEGKLQCYGTPIYLKQKYGTGYNLKLLINMKEPVKHTVSLLENDINHYVENIQDELKCKSIDGHEVSFLLPIGYNYINLFEHLERKKEQGVIDAISFTLTTLEDVFLSSKIVTKPDADKTENIEESLEKLKITPNQNYKTTVLALFIKKIRFIQNKLYRYILPAFIAALMMMFCVALDRWSLSSSVTEPPFKLNLTTYGETNVYFNGSADPNIINMKEMYRKAVLAQGSKPIEVNDVSQEIANVGVQNMPYYRLHLAVGAEFRQEGQTIEIVALYNNLFEHSAPISVNLITNTLAKTLIGPKASISIVNHPLEYISYSEYNAQLSIIEVGLLWLTILPVGFLYFMGTFIYFPFSEISTNFTQLQFMCGVSPWVYWLTNLITDYVIYIIFAFVLSLCSLLWTPFHNEIASMFSILLLYGASGIPFAYLFSTRKSFSGAYALYIVLGILLGIIPCAVVVALFESHTEPYLGVGQFLEVAFLILCPPFGFTYLGVNFSKKVIENYNFNHMTYIEKFSKCNAGWNPCCGSDTNACIAHQSFMPFIRSKMLYILLGAFIYFICMPLSHMQFKTFLKRYNKNNTQKPDEEYENEKYLTVSRLKKKFAGKNVVDNLDFELDRGECLGLLGTNGAGKTTTFRMLTRDEIMDQGTISLGPNKISDHQYLKRLGYCPQNDALNLSLTGRQIIETMVKLRGIEDKSAVDTILILCDLQEIADIPCGFYSGGNKRKLCFALSIIGFPDVVLLDEPTNGVDPVTRRKFWSLIKNIKEIKRVGFILTSHSMEECEALCNNVKIMKEGRISEQGTISKLKSDIGGFSIKLKLRPDASRNTKEYDIDVTDGVSGSSELSDIDNVKEFLNKTYNGTIKSEHPTLLHYYINNKENIRWSRLFKDFDKLKEDYSQLIEDYVISDASLEDVFLDVAERGITPPKQKG